MDDKIVGALPDDSEAIAKSIAGQKGVPIYLEDRTLIGTGTISEDGRHIDIRIDSEYPIAELMSENLIGLSTFSIASKDRTETIVTNSEYGKEINDANKS